jgi:hypothetical protein
VPPLAATPAGGRPLAGAAAAAGLVAAVSGLLLLLGWAAGVELRAGEGGSAAVVPGTAAALAAAGLAAIGLARPGHAAAARVLALAAALAAGAVLGSSALGVESGAGGSGLPWRAIPPGAAAVCCSGSGSPPRAGARARTCSRSRPRSSCWRAA